MEEEDFLILLEAQDGVCAICQANPAKHTDHNHLTGQIRGLLCVACNNGLGLFRDDWKLMQRAIVYLKGGQ